MWEMVLKKTRKLIPLYNFVCTIAASPPLTQLQFFLEPLAFPDITDLCNTYGQTVLNTVFYCIRTYVYYIHREKEILLGKWVGDMTVVTIKSSKTLTFKIPTRQQSACNPLTSITNSEYFPGILHQSCVPEMLEDTPTLSYQYPLVCTDSTSYSALHPAAVAGPGMGGNVLLGDSDLRTGLDCSGGAVGCNCGGKVAGDCKSDEPGDNTH